MKHKADDLLDGETVVLTLADRSILNAETGDLDDDTDALENISIAEQKRRNKITEAGKKVRLDDTMSFIENFGFRV